MLLSSIIQKYNQVNKAIDDTPVHVMLSRSQFIHVETRTFVNNETIQIMNLHQFGFILYIPPNASLGPVTFTVGVSLSRDFIPPPNTTLVSALYYIKTSSELLRPVTIEIEHCVNTDSVDAAKLTFAKAGKDYSSTPYSFEMVSGGRFGSSWGVIFLSDFSQVGIFAENASGVSYHAQLLRTHRQGAPGTYRYFVDLVVSHKLSAMNEV